MLTLPTKYQVSREETPPPQPLFLRVPAFLFSVILHPLFIPVMGVAFLAYIQQGYFTGISDRDKSMIILRVAVNTIFFPFITVLLLRGIGFIKSIYLKSQKERIIPYVATNIFYFWMFLVFKNQPEVPAKVTSFILGVFLSSSAALVLNSFFKISMHALGMGALCGLLLIITYTGNPYNTFLPLLIVFLLTGIVGSSRLILNSHNLSDIYGGVLVAILCQVIAYIFYG